MITRFHVINFRSIVDATLDLRYAEGKAPPKWKETSRLPFWQDPDTGDRVVPCFALFGSNAAGKTNLFKALETLKRFVVISQIDVRDLFAPNRIVTCGPETIFELEGTVSRLPFLYRLVQSTTGIVGESLSLHGTVLFSVVNGVLSDGNDNHDRHVNFVRNDNDSLATDNYPLGKLQDILDVECKDESGSMIRPFLNCIGHGYRGLNEGASHVYALLARLLVLENDKDFSNFPTLLEEYCRCSNKRQNEALEEIVGFLRQLDSDIRGLTLEEGALDANAPKRYDFQRIDTGVPVSYLSVLSLHKDAMGKDILFRFFEEESAGTIRLASLLCLMLIALSTGMPLFADEFDRSLHPILVAALVRLFTDRKRNPRGAQLVLATHCTELLDNAILRLSEVAIVSKTLLAGTKVRRLVDLKKDGEDIRNVTDFRRNYLAGFYSGIPYPTL